NWQRFALNSIQNMPFFSEIARNSAVKFRQRDSADIELIKKLTNAALPEKTSILAAFLETELKSALDIAANTYIDSETSFASLGVDSLMAVELRNKLTKIFGNALYEPLSATMLLNYPNIGSLLEYLLKTALRLVPLNVSDLDATVTAKSWITIPVPRPNAKMRLLCFLYMGGSVDAYYSWAN